MIEFFVFFLGLINAFPAFAGFTIPQSTGAKAVNLSAGTISPVGNPACGSTSSSATLTIPYTKSAAGNALVVAILPNYNGNSSTTVSDGGSTYTLLKSEPASSGYYMQLFGTLSLASSSGNIVVNITGSTTVTACVQEFYGVAEWGNTAVATSASAASYSGSVTMHSETGNYAVAGVGTWLSNTYSATTGVIDAQSNSNSNTSMITSIAGTSGASMILSGTASASHSYAMALVELRAH